MLDWQVFLSAENFWLAWKKVRSNNGCAGSDGETIADFARNETQNLARLRRSLELGIYQLPPPLYVVMGYKVRDEKPIEIKSKEWSWKNGMSTLYLVKQGTMLRKDHGRFVIESGRFEPDVESESANAKSPAAPLEIPIAEVGRILVLGRIQLSTSAIEVCLEEQIPVIFMSQLGSYKGHLWSSEFCDLPTEAAQFGRRQDRSFQLEMARQIVWGKGLNSKLTLQRFNRRRKADGVGATLKRIDQLLNAIQQTTDLGQLRGYEGAIAKLYFAGLGQMITNPGFSLTGRNRRPPKDPVNSLLSFGYTLLFNNVLSLILAEGLNPYLGNLHRSERKEMHLAFDLVEEFRAPVVDSLVIALVNQKVLRPTDFTFPNSEGGVYLETGSRRVFLKHFEERISETFAHPRTQQQVSYRRAIQLQVQHYKQCLRSAESYQPFIRSNK